MIKGKHDWKIWVFGAIGLAMIGAVVPLVVLAGSQGELTVTPYSDVIRFEALGVASLQVQIFDLSGRLLWDSGVVSGAIVDWDRADKTGERLAYGAYLYLVQGWDGTGKAVLLKKGKLSLLPGDKLKLQQAPDITPGPSAPSLSEPPITLQPLTYTINDDLVVNGKITSQESGTVSNFLDVKAGSSGDRAGFRLFGYNASNAGDYAVFTLRTDYADAVFSVYDASGGTWHPAYRFFYLQNKYDFKNNQVVNVGKLGVGTGSPSAGLHIYYGWPQLKLDTTWNSHWFTLSTGIVGVSFDDDQGNEPFVIDYGAPDAMLYISSAGGVGIGDFDNPRGGLEIDYDVTDYELYLDEDGGTTGDHVQIYFENESDDWMLGANSGTGIFYLNNVPASADIWWAWYDHNNGIGWFEVLGNLNVWGTKNFVEGDPDDPTKVIVYSALEGPEAGTYVRGTAQLVNGEAVIELPDHFAKVTAEKGLTVILTPIREWLQLYVVEKTTSRIVVREANGKSGTFDYLVQGIRKGYEDFQVVRDKAAYVPRTPSGAAVQGGPATTKSPSPPEEGTAKEKRNIAH